MSRITVSPEARRDLVAIRQYIRDELSNPAAANHIIRSLRQAIEGLETFPHRGRPLDALIPVHTEYRYMPCENYCIFYTENNDDVIILRILHQKQDCLRALFQLQS